MRFDIKSDHVRTIGRVDIIINKQKDFEKWCNPSTVESEAVEEFKLAFPKSIYTKLTAYYVGDLIPTLKP